MKTIFLRLWILSLSPLFAQSTEDLWSKLFMLENDLKESEWISLDLPTQLEFSVRLQHILSHKEMSIRARAAWALGNLGVSNDSIRDSLKKTLSDPELLVQLEVTEALRKLGDLEILASPLPRQALQDKRYILRIRALEILSHFASEESLEAVCAKLTDRDWTLRRMAAITLGKIKSLKAVPPLLTLLRKERSVSVLQEVIQTLGAIRDPESVSALLPFLNHSSLFIREQTSEVLAQITGQHYGYNLKQFKERQKQYTVLSSEAQARFIEEIHIAMQDGNWEIRLSAISFLSELGTDPEISYLIQALQDPARQVRYSAAGALGKLKLNAISAIPALIQNANDPDEYVRMWSIWALGQIDASQNASLFEKALEDPNPQVRRVAEQALKRIQ
ncbi:MAG: HEAT repeat domain-containing protein [Planctomycetota bacterium]